MSDFWSRRKAAVNAEAEADQARLRQAETEAQEARLAARSDAEILAELDVPPPEEMASPGEITDFLKENIPHRLRTRALRRLWRLNPALANLDGLLDYGEDYTDAATVVENLATVYQVGKGMLARFDEVADANPEVTDPADGEEAGAHAVPPQAEAPPAAVPDRPTVAPIAPPTPEEEGEMPATTMRRMKFQFPEPS